MKSTNRRQFEAQEQTLGVCDKRSDVFRDNPVADEMLAQLRASTGSVKAADAEHRAGIAAVRIATLERGRVRITMRRSVKAIAATGPVVARTTGTVEQFELPRNLNDRDLVAVAKDFAARATPLADTFARHKLAPNVIADLPGQIAAMEKAIDAPSEARRRHKVALQVAKKDLGRGAEAMNALERIYMNALGHDDQAVRDWKEARRIGPARAKQASAPMPEPSPVKVA